MRKRSILLVTVAFGLGCAAHASVTVHPIKNDVYYTKAERLWQCDSSGTVCGDPPITLDFEPIDAVFVGGDLWLLSQNAVHNCSGTSVPCGKIPLGGVKRGASLSSGGNGAVFVVTEGGELLGCDKTGCKVVKQGGTAPPQ